MDRKARVILPPGLTGIERYHRNALLPLFGPSPPREPIDPGMRFLFLCFTNRSGSNFLAHLIASTGILNTAEEVFNAPTMQSHVQAHGLRSLSGYVNFLCRRLNMSGWLTAKIGIEQLVMLTEADVLDQIIDRARFILIERQDRPAQAISRLVAIQNQQWTSEQVAKMPEEALVYSRDIIRQQEAEVAAQVFGFYSFFASNNLVPKHLAYEAVIQHPQEHLADIGAWLGLEPFIGNVAALPIRRQTSAVKQVWRARYKAGL